MPSVKYDGFFAVRRAAQSLPDRMADPGAGAHVRSVCAMEIDEGNEKEESVIDRARRSLSCAGGIIVAIMHKTRRPFLSKSTKIKNLPEKVPKMPFSFPME